MTYPGLDNLATIFTPAVGGSYTVVAKANLACRLALVSAETAAGGAERSELLRRRQLLWEEAYTIPRNAQVEIDGQRWNPVSGSQAVVYSGLGAGRAYHHRHCELTEAGT